MSFIQNIVSQMSTADKEKLGKRGGSKINTNGAHKVRIVEAYESEFNGDDNFYVKFEDAAGKAAEWKGYLTKTIGEEGGVPRAGMYSVNGIQTQLNDKDDKCDNLVVIGHIKNLWRICGLDGAEFGSGIASAQVKAYGKDTTVDMWTELVGKELTIVTSFEVSADKKDPKKTWRNQKVSISNLFNKDRLSQFEIDEGKTEPKAIEEAVRTAKEPAAQFADIGYGIKFSDKANKACIQELKLIANADKVPTAQVIDTPVDGTDPF